MTFLRFEDARDEYEKSLWRQIDAKRRERNSTLQPQARIAIQNEINALGEQIKNYRKNGASHE